MISADEFRPPVARFKKRRARLHVEGNAAVAAHKAERSLHLVIGQIDGFARRAHTGLGGPGWHGRRDIICAVVPRIEIDHDAVEAVFRARHNSEATKASHQARTEVATASYFGDIVAQAVVRLVGVLLLEQHGDWSIQRC